MFRNALLVSAAAASVLLASSPGFALIQLGTVEAYHVQDGQNGVLQSRRNTSDRVVAVTRDGRSVIATDMQPAAMRMDTIRFPERTPSGKN